MATLLGNYKIAAERIGMPLKRYIELAAEGRRRCNTCKRWLPKEWFYRSNLRLHQCSSRCKACNREHNRKLRAKRAKERHGLTSVQEYT
jgi:hypothetical protein